MELTTLSPKRRVTDTVVRGAVTASVALAVVPLGWLIYTLVARGIGPILDIDWWTKSERFGGAANAIVGTLMQTAIAAVVAIPLGVLVAIYLVEYADSSRRLVRITTFMVDVLSGVPSIVAALFIYAVWRTTFDMPRSGFAVALALVLLMVPLVVRATEEMLKIVPQDLREAAYALGVPKWKTIVRIVLPTAMSGIITGIMLAIARVMGESAPVLILVGASRAMNYNPFVGNQESLPLMMIQEYNQGPSGYETVWGAALTLVIAVAIVYVLARVLARFTGPRMERS
ncbi:phosphate ABC transporter permease PstA [Gordonia sp. (in: high G+C Gram-positive bacteria)]|uniref:phosphate ABC transporter permease PstA n=1 Tax=Gordonia sp. (in: high G+C Gram-positive bacteria) TaxID=84139 RepID=UPI00168E6AC9|nr:phosphate ABC transporter permease PstA [Gordonia sp. (in: high G+C Gram-positive bacteria)]NLG46154.1 phosphate ABC transporter permease PstA [Gordonia sp. (in: high G+C Gram-positive bacteria)]